MAMLNKLWQQFLGSLPTIVGVVIGLVFLGAFALIVVIILGYLHHWPWTGFTEHVGQPLLPNQPYSPERTLWDWLQLLFIPGVLAVGGYLLNQTADRHQQITTDENTRDTAFQAYLDKMSEVLLDKEHPLRNSAENDEVRKIARARTLAVLRGLDPARKAGLLLYLIESELIEREDCIIDLKQADFSKADLRIAYLSNDPLNGRPTKVTKKWLSDPDLVADLHSAKLCKTIFIEAKLPSANLSNADLSHTYLRQADLRKADLSGADLSGADLSGANLSSAIVTHEQLDTAKSLQGARMPDGSIHLQ